MEIDKVRKIDYWVGVPLCFLLSGINFTQRLLCRKKETKPPRKILFIKLSELGAIILAYPLLNQIKKEYPSTELFFMTFYQNKDIFKLEEGIIQENNILAIREEARFFVLDTLRIIQRLRKERIDIVFDLEFFSRISAILAYSSGAAKRIGFHRYTFEGLYRGNLLTHKIQYNPLNHISLNYLSLLQGIEQLRKNEPHLEEKMEEKAMLFPKYASNDKIREKVLNKIVYAGLVSENNKLFLINAGEGILPLREWPVEYFIVLIKLLLEDHNNAVILIGTEGAAVKANAILKAINNLRCLSLVNQTEIKELMELFSFSAVLISNDCGLAHLAMFTQIKKFVLFGPESPKIFGPLGENSHIIYSDWPCSPCLSVLNHRFSACRYNKCLKVINPQDVYELVKKSC